ncbi:MAG: DUF488 domain-containing protein [Chloroflexi bacterium]|nr:DUF488 domain-containing protein [Chloroflexota bacterium]
MNTIYTIGHSVHDWETFLGLLTRHGVDVVVDTRSAPVSRRAAFANKRTMPALLEQEDISYVFLGDALGGKPSDDDLYSEDGKPDYRKMRSQGSFQAGIDAVIELAAEHTIALMCSEEDPSKCHRHLLIEPAMIERGVGLMHIRGAGPVQHSDALSNSKLFARQSQTMLAV